MRSGPRNRPSSVKRRVAAFTLAEVLAALVFMAIVIPVAVEGVRIASLAGQVAERKAVAARVADRVLNELLATGNWQRSSQRGTTREGFRDYRWSLEEEPWEMGDLRVLSVEVLFEVQGQDYEVRLSTLADPSAGLTTSTNTTSTTTGGTTP